MKNDSDFVIMPDEICEPYFTNATRETVLRVTFAENFDKFEYDAETSTYYAEEEIEAIYYRFSGEEAGVLYCYNNEVKIADGKIISIACDYRFNSMDNDKYSFIYYNIGMSEVKIPQSIIDSAEEYVNQDNNISGGNTNNGDADGNN